MTEPEERELLEAQRLVEQLQAELDAEPADDVDIAEHEHGPLPLEELLAESGDDLFDPIVDQAVEVVLERREGVDPKVRLRLIRAAERGMRKRRATEGPLQLRLELQRAERAIAAERLAAEMGIDPAQFLELERGTIDIRDVGAPAIAAWIDVVGDDDEPALGALRQALARRNVAAAAGSSPVEQEAAAETFVQEVREALRARRARG